MFLWFIFDSKNFENSQDTYHDKSILVSVMRTHEFSDFSTEIGHENQKDKNSYHKRFSIRLCPICECWVIWSKVFRLEKSESTHDNDKKEGKYAGFWDSQNHRFSNFRESFFEHFERSEEDNKKSKPLNGWEFFEHFCDPAWGYDHENNRNNQSNPEVHDISMACSSDREDIVERHSHISNDDSLDGGSEGICFFSSLFVMFVSANLTIELPYDIEKQEGSEEFESWNLHEPDGSEGEKYSKNRRTCNSPENRFLAFRSLKFFRCHADEDRIVSTHDEVDEDDIEQREESRGSKKMSKIGREAG